MTGPAVRSRLVVLRRDRDAARRGRELLEQKREVILREVMRRTVLRDQERERLRAALAEARRLLRVAQVELGRAAVDAAVLAQPETAVVERRECRLVGVSIPGLYGAFPPFRPYYAPGGTAESLDRAGEAFAALLPMLVRLAEEERAVDNLQRGLVKTSQRLNAIEQVVLPGLEREIRAVAGAIEEEDRDESFRRKRWLSGRAGVLAG